MKAVVTGGAGFIGSHIAERLLHDGHEVHVVDNFLTGRRDNLQTLSAQPGFTLHQQSITELEPLAAIFEAADTVFHQAALPSVPRSVADPLETHLHCVTGTLTVLEAARNAGVRRVVYAS
jgi:UDP-glucose 4-epimerase